MPKSQKLAALTAKLNEIKAEPTSELGLATLQEAIASRHSVAIAQAADLVAKFEISAFVSPLTERFHWLMSKAADRDPGCRAKAAIADCLYRLASQNEAVFLSGVRHVQQELVWGGKVDTAPKLRGLCALGLVRLNYVDVMIELADLLADAESEARIGAARAIAYSGQAAGIGLLRLRIKVGDTPTVLGECVAALLQLSLPYGLPLAAACLKAGRRESDAREAIETAEVVALVLGESRLPEALPLLQDWWQHTTHAELRQTGLLAIAMLRRDAAIQWLLQLLTDASPKDAAGALEALGLYQNDSTLWSQVTAILNQRQDLDP
ncbi:MAG: HEAT repeat domain-containing protein [Cyanobacteria bacterium P01_C01_bin.120]